MVEAALDRKAEDIVVMDLAGLTDFTDVFVIASGRSEHQVRAIADAVVQRAAAEGRNPIGIEGYTAGRWVLVDLGDVIVHAFLPDEREVYRLERLWGDAPVVLRLP